MNKTCNVCLVEKDIDSFYQNSPGAYRALCKKCDLERAANYRRNNLEYVRKKNREARAKRRYSAKVRAQNIVDRMKVRSRRKGFPTPEFTTLEVEKAIAGGVCKKTGIPFDFSQSIYNCNPFSPVPDRIDSTIGYTKENVQWVCSMYNTLKSDYTEKEVSLFIDAYIKNRTD